MMRRHWASVAWISVLMGLNSWADDGPHDDRPNIVILMADDMGFSDIGCYGSEIQTPNLDRLANNGLRFTDFYNNAKCEPTRASLLTGKYAQAVGASPTATYSSPTFAEVVRPAGYRTLMTGKWHAGQKPFDRGFDRHFGLTDGCCNFFNPGIPRPDDGMPSHKSFPRRWAIDGQEIQPFTPRNKDFYTTDAFTDNAIAYLKQYKDEDKPFVLYIGYTCPHYPMHAWPSDIAKYRGKYKDGWHELRATRYKRLGELGLFRKLPKLSPADPQSPDWNSLSEAERDDWDLRMAVYAAMIDRMDQNIGKLLDALDKFGKADNTLVMFLSDNGGESNNADWSRQKGTPAGPLESFRTVGQPWANASNIPFRKYKTFNYEGGISTPMVAYWPGVIKPGSITDQVGHLIDFLPTITELAQAEYPVSWAGQPNRPPAGKSLVPIFRGEQREPHESICWQWSSAGAIRMGHWKLVRDKGNRGQPADWELYDLADDRSELNNLADQEPDRVQRMSERWNAWQTRPF
jgi:arylsulfatase